MNIPTALPRLSAIAAFAAAPLTALLVEPSPALAHDSIAVINRGEMINWVADHERGLWIQVGELKWFYASFADTCRGLGSTNSLSFDTPASGNIGRTSAVVVSGGGSCIIRTIAPSSGPPKDRYASVLFQPQTQ